MEYGTILNHINYFIEDRDEINRCTRLLNSNRQAIHEMILDINEYDSEFKFRYSEEKHGDLTFGQLIVSNEDNLEYKLDFTYKIDDDTLEYIIDEPVLNVHRIELIN